ncbi:MAG TPA: hypothetical protein VFZ34_22515 [Blastocatellia bacterium]|nr:hypothetical protein [Blastocatellia bacterium]
MFQFFFPAPIFLPVFASPNPAATRHLYQKPISILSLNPIFAGWNIFSLRWIKRVEDEGSNARSTETTLAGIPD